MMLSAWTQRFLVAVPDDPPLVERLIGELEAQADPAITVTRDPVAVLAFECETWDSMLRSRVVQAPEVAVGPDWQKFVQAVE